MWITDGKNVVHAREFYDSVDYPRVYVENDARFARALCHVLNSTAIHKINATHEDMNLKGIPRV
jgi:hypothetical protein